MSTELIRQRFATDCGVASLANAMGVTWGNALDACFPLADDRPTADRYYGLEADAMRAAIVAAGASVAQSSTYGRPPVNTRGVMLVMWEGSWAEKRHWIAYETLTDGSAWLLLTNGERTLYQNLHVLGYRMLEWYAIRKGEWVKPCASSQSPPQSPLISPLATH